MSANPAKICTPDSVLKTISDILKCELCKYHLSPPVKLLVGDKTVICGRCSKTYQMCELSDCAHLQKIGDLLEYPCYFAKFGCRELVSWKEAEVHEDSCPFRQYLCPSADLVTPSCKWTGSATNIREHYSASHKILTEDLSLNFEDDAVNYLVESSGELFVFQMVCDTKEDTCWFDVRFLGPRQRAARFHFKINLYTQDVDQQADKREYIERKQVEPDTPWKLDKNSAVGIRIGMVKAMLKNSVNIYLTLTVSVRKPLYNGKADQALMQEVECPVCKDHMLRPIRMCEQGHNICDNCFLKLIECPTCRGKLSQTRNISLETLSEHMHYRCIYFDEGCQFTDVPENIKEHEMFCDVSYYDCPLKQLVNCKWRGKVSHVCIHASKEHQFTF